MQGFVSLVYHASDNLWHTCFKDLSRPLKDLGALVSVVKGKGEMTSGNGWAKNLIT